MWQYRPEGTTRRHREQRLGKHFHLSTPNFSRRFIADTHKSFPSYGMIAYESDVRVMRAQKF